jgi:tetratricopeptide (TPR) repeat protein
MPRDWDLFTLPAPVLLFFSIALINKFENNARFIGKISGGILALSLLALPMFIVNSDKDFVSKRMESMGVHIYNSYWVNSGYVINAAMQADKNDKQQYLYRYYKLFSKIEPKYKGKNYEYSLLATKIGNIYAESGQYEDALKYYKMADEYYSADKIIMLNLGTTYYTLKNYRESLKYAESLLKIEAKNPDYLMLAINSSFRLKIWEKAIKYADSYLEINPADEAIAGMLKKLKNR